MTGTLKGKPNHLIHEKSPYLLQHAYNPVEWYAWGQTAIDKARQEDKPILVSIGYSTCHWCHVMEEESFANQQIADIMNAHFVCIKIDREERPDLDKIYITAVSALNGSAGWPLNVFLTPSDLKPFFGGTYFPVNDRPGILAWPKLLKRIAYVWETPDLREKALRSADTVTNIVKNYLVNHPAEDGHNEPFDERLAERALISYGTQYDKEHGGFSNAPKFPTPVNQNFLLHYDSLQLKNTVKTADSKSARGMAVATLEHMANGGIYDHIGGGFHRYATDNDWHVPHFEKMLYDNAQLIDNYATAYQLTAKNRFKIIAEETIAYVLRDMTHPRGGFYSAEDADSLPPDVEADTVRKAEGAFYTWKFQAIEALLEPPMLDIFAYHYGIKPGGNVRADPFGEFRGKNIAAIAHSRTETAHYFDMPPDKIDEYIQQAKQILFAKRNERPRPHRDDKVITAWNGLMISALVTAYQTIGTATYLKSAMQAAAFIHDELFDHTSQELYRIWREGERKITAIADDYAFLIQGLIDLYESCFDLKWLNWALALMNIQLERFYDPLYGGFFLTSSEHDNNLILRIKEDTDSVFPSANAVSAINLIRLAGLTGNSRYSEYAEKTVRYAYSRLQNHSVGAPQMLIAMRMLSKKPLRIILTGDQKEERFKQMLEPIRSLPRYRRTIAVVNGDASKNLFSKHLPEIPSMMPVDNNATAYVCDDTNCKAPATTRADIETLLGIFRNS